LPTGGATPSYLHNLLPESAFGKPDQRRRCDTHVAVAGTPPGINNDILVTRELGPWMMLTCQLLRLRSPMRARENGRRVEVDLQAPATVFTTVRPKNMRAELERVKKIIEQQARGLEAERAWRWISRSASVTVHHDEHCGVLVGGYATQERGQARAQLRSLTHRIRRASISTSSSSWMRRARVRRRCLRQSVHRAFLVTSDDQGGTSRRTLIKSTFEVLRPDTGQIQAVHSAEEHFAPRFIKQFNFLP